MFPKVLAVSQVITERAKFKQLKGIVNPKHGGSSLSGNPSRQEASSEMSSACLFTNDNFSVGKGYFSSLPHPLTRNW